MIDLDSVVNQVSAGTKGDGSESDRLFRRMQESLSVSTRALVYGVVHGTKPIVVGRELGISYDAVRKRLCDAKRRLAERGEKSSSGAAENGPRPGSQEEHDRLVRLLAQNPKALNAHFMLNRYLDTKLCPAALDEKKRVVRALVDVTAGTHVAGAIEPRVLQESSEEGCDADAGLEGARIHLQCCLSSADDVSRAVKRMADTASASGFAQRKSAAPINSMVYPPLLVRAHKARSAASAAEGFVPLLRSKDPLDYATGGTMLSSLIAGMDGALVLNEVLKGQASYAGVVRDPLDPSLRSAAYAWWPVLYSVLLVRTNRGRELADSVRRKMRDILIGGEVLEVLGRHRDLFLRHSELLRVLDQVHEQVHELRRSDGSAAVSFA